MTWFESEMTFKEQNALEKRPDVSPEGVKHGHMREREKAFTPCEVRKQFSTKNSFFKPS